MYASLQNNHFLCPRVSQAHECLPLIELWRNLLATFSRGCLALDEA